ncbi:hypothetical protein BGZ65_010076 [Modicella reniformis]|uniref:Uncharacterized protein n=1 Tax=Modicella reniformis TaxID=1440133 RepID=A0A9P6II78_9FUNG|nr:hypothetical protein BGZ65_010076 [Modicella reniformis]
MGTQAQINGQIAALDSADSYCFFLPPELGGDIAANEDRAIAFCNKANSRAPGAKIFPSGFVLSAHWATGPSWVQITGQIDPVQYALSPCDTGGQYDIKAPIGATCVGYKYFVNVIEPELGVYGMRCCQEKADCDVNHSTYGVKRIYGEQYDFSGPRADGPLPLSLQCVSGTLPAGITTPTPSGTDAAPTNLPSTTPIATTSPSGSTQVTSASTTSNKDSSSAASGNSAMIATTAVLATVVALVMA